MSQTFDTVRLFGQSGIVVVSAYGYDELSQDAIAMQSDMATRQMSD
jgi:hypothetical protein